MLLFPRRGGLREILLQGCQLRIEVLCKGIQSRQEGTEIIAVSSQALGERAERPIQVDWVDLLQQADERLKQRIDF